LQLRTESQPQPVASETRGIPSTVDARPDLCFLVPEQPAVPEALEDDSEGSAFDTPVLISGGIRVSDIPRLDRYRFHSVILPEPYDRSVTVYLPRAYDSEPDRRFPVFYLHDGQNLFDERTSYVPGHPWFAHTTADRLTDAGEIEPVILVGIANTGQRRMAEYTPTRDFKLGGGEGRSYSRMLIEELKPQIDLALRTLPGRATTAVGGSSLGGLISLFLGFEEPGVFGKIAVMSPSIWWDHRSILSFVEAPSPRPELRIWLDMGTSEGAKHLRDTDQLFRLLKRRGWREHVDLAYQRVAGGIHSEDAWADRFGDVLRFLFPAS
jgi:predicted alpha/beta superfamily hydrolase